MAIFGRRDDERDERIASLESTVSTLIAAVSQQQSVLEKLVRAHGDLVTTVRDSIESQSSCSEEVVRALLATAKGMSSLQDDALAALEIAFAAQDDVQRVRESQLEIIGALHAREKSAEASIALPAPKTTKAEGAN